MISRTPSAKPSDDADDDERPRTAAPTGRGSRGNGGDRQLDRVRAHAVTPPIIIRTSRRRLRGRPRRRASTTAPCSMNITVSATASAIDTDCSTMTTVVPSSRIDRTTASSCSVTTRRQPDRQLVEEQQARAGHQRPPERDHLLLAARQRAAALAQPARRAAGTPRARRRGARARARRCSWNGKAPIHRFSSTVSVGNVERPPAISVIPSLTR